MKAYWEFVGQIDHNDATAVRDILLYIEPPKQATMKLKYMILRNNDSSDTYNAKVYIGTGDSTTPPRLDVGLYIMDTYTLPTATNISLPNPDGLYSFGALPPSRWIIPHGTALCIFLDNYDKSFSNLGLLIYCELNLLAVPTMTFSDAAGYAGRIYSDTWNRVKTAV